MLLYGISGGGQMAHRLALQVPERFFAIHIHVNSSYDLPRRGGERMLWMVTTGTLEAGYPEAQRFYRRALDLGYHMIFKAEENLGHADSPAIRKLSLAFFDFCLPFLPDAAWTRSGRPRPRSGRTSCGTRFIWGIGTTSSSSRRRWAESRIPPEFLVSLPSRGIAEAWGDDCGMKSEEWCGGVVEWCSAFALPPYAKASFYALPPAPRLPSTLSPLRQGYGGQAELRRTRRRASRGLRNWASWTTLLRSAPLRQGYGGQAELAGKLGNRETLLRSTSYAGQAGNWRTGNRELDN